MIFAGRTNGEPPMAVATNSNDPPDMMAAVGEFLEAASNLRATFSIDRRVVSVSEGDGLSVVRAARQPAVLVRLGPIPLLPLPHTYGNRNCLLTQFSSRPSRR
jgi:hypothetical protein